MVWKYQEIAAFVEIILYWLQGSVLMLSTRHLFQVTLFLCNIFLCNRAHLSLWSKSCAFSIQSSSDRCMIEFSKISTDN